jgi:glyoxylase-like metal-dependent hydrolase (beta-lactamase superfamily II)
VHRVPLPLPNDGLRAVNVYVLATADGLTLVDAGWALAESRQVLADALAELGGGFADVRRFLVTHVHRDHYTQAVAVRRDFGTHVVLGAGERAAFDVLHDPGHRPLDTQIALMEVLGAADLAEQLRRSTSGHALDRTDWERPDEWLDEGTMVLPGGRSLEAVATPGHTAGHVVFHDLAGRLLFAGDHVLPTITPSIGLEPVRQPDPLGAFLRSLALVRSRPDALLLPAHGPVAPSVHARVDELVDHHGQRLDEMGAVARGRGVTAREVAAQVLWTKRGRGFGELDLFNQMLAVAETSAHLHLLAEQGRLTRETTDGVERYR